MDFGDIVVPPEIREALGEFAIRLNNELGLTAEQKQAALERSMKLQSDPDFMQKIIEAVEKGFAEADANSNGVLTADEFITFIALMKAGAAER